MQLAQNIVSLQSQFHSTPLDKILILSADFK